MKLRHVLLPAALVGVGIIVIVNMGDLSKFIGALKSLRWYVIPLVIFVQLASYYVNARYYRSFFAISGYSVDLRRLFEASLAINFANQVLPSGGVAGTTYLSEAVKAQAPAGATVLAQVGRYIFTFTSYFIVLATGFLFLFFGDGNQLGKVSVRLVIVLMLAFLAGGTVLLAVFSERARLEAALRPVIWIINGFGRRILRRKTLLLKPAQIDHFLSEFYDGCNMLVKHKERWTSLLSWSLAYNVAEVLTVYVIFVGLGLWINPGVVITGYTLAVIASVAGFLTGGVGVYELSMIGTFAALGVPFAMAFTVVIVYRSLSMILFLPPGFYYYRRHLASSEQKAAA